MYALDAVRKIQTLLVKSKFPKAAVLPRPGTACDLISGLLLL